MQETIPSHAEGQISLDSRCVVHPPRRAPALHPAAPPFFLHTGDVPRKCYYSRFTQVPREHHVRTTTSSHPELVRRVLLPVLQSCI